VQEAVTVFVDLFERSNRIYPTAQTRNFAGDLSGAATPVIPSRKRVTPPTAESKSIEYRRIVSSPLSVARPED
jgi:hypothetical protein